MQLDCTMVQSLIEGGPTGTYEATESLILSLFQWLLVGGEKHRWCPEVRGCCSGDPLDDLERLDGGGCTKGETCLFSHGCIAQAAGLELLQGGCLIFACSTPADPVECLSEHAALGSNLKSDGKFLLTHQRTILSPMIPGSVGQGTKRREPSPFDCSTALVSALTCLFRMSSNVQYQISV